VALAVALADAAGLVRAAGRGLALTQDLHGAPGRVALQGDFPDALPRFDGEADRNEGTALNLDHLGLGGMPVEEDLPGGLGGLKGPGNQRQGQKQAGQDQQRPSASEDSQEHDF